MDETTIEQAGQNIDRQLAERDQSARDFRAWMRETGHHGKQVAAAGALIGMSPSLAINTSSGKRVLTETERLAMSAVIAGLRPWSPENNDKTKGLRQAREQIIALAQTLSSGDEGDNPRK